MKIDDPKKFLEQLSVEFKNLPADITTLNIEWNRILFDITEDGLYAFQAYQMAKVYGVDAPDWVEKFFLDAIDSFMSNKTSLNDAFLVKADNKHAKARRHKLFILLYSYLYIYEDNMSTEAAFRQVSKDFSALSDRPNTTSNYVKQTYYAFFREKRL